MIIRMIIQRGIYYEKGVSNFCGCDGCYERCMHVRECGYGRAMQLSSAERLADRIVAVSRSVETDGSETTVYRNVAEYKNTLARNYRLSEEARAKLLYKSMGVPEDQIDAMEKDKLLEVFDYTECTQTTNYIATINGENENISRAQMVNALSRSDDYI